MTSKKLAKYVLAIRASGKCIYDPIALAASGLWLPNEVLQALLEQGLRGVNLAGLPLRTRSKVVKAAVCEALGYPIPKAFKKTRPKFPGQDFDVFSQKSNNLQVWNEEIVLSRRYVIIRISDSDEINAVKVVDGQTLARLDTTGTITTKYQARVDTGSVAHVLTTPLDTEALRPHLGTGPSGTHVNPSDAPKSGQLLPVADLFSSLSKLVGESFDDPGTDQERNRGAALHVRVCQALGYGAFGDNGQFPDVRHQLLEIKLQTSPTIDLGLILPNSTEPLAVPDLGSAQPRHRDVRYAVFCGKTDGVKVTLTHLFVTTGEAFFRQFRRFEGNVKNGKLQIPLPGNFFER